MGDWTASEFSDKVDHEGGLYCAVTGYGLSFEVLDKDKYPELYLMLKEYDDMANSLREYEHGVFHRLEEAAQNDPPAE